MSQGFAPFYDVNRTYEDNYLQGPFGAFAEVMKGDSAAGASAQSAQTTQSQSSDQAEEFLGFRVNLPFGIPAGPLLNERFTTAAFRMGFDLAVYKTVRSRAWGCNAFPNVLAVHPKNADGSLFPAAPNWMKACLLTPDMSFRFRSPTVSACRRVTPTNGSRT